MPYCREPRHKCRWDAHVSPLKVSQPLRMPWRLEKERSMCIYIYTYKYYNMAGSERRESANDASETSPPEERAKRTRHTRERNSSVNNASDASPPTMRAKRVRQTSERNDSDTRTSEESPPPPTMRIRQTMRPVRDRQSCERNESTRNVSVARPAKVRAERVRQQCERNKSVKSASERKGRQSANEVTPCEANRT